MRLHTRIAVLRERNEPLLKEKSYTSDEAWTEAVCTPDGRDRVREYYREKGGIGNIPGHVAKLTWRWVHESSKPGDYHDVLVFMGFRPIEGTTWYVK